MTKEEKIQTFMKNLDLSREDAIQLMVDDDRIDHGEKLFELTAEQKKAEKNARKTGTRTVYNFTKRERKPNLTKGQIIEELFKFLTENAPFEAKEVQITNKERVITFKMNENDYELVLTQKRKPKNK